MLLAGARRLHAILVEGVIDELERQGEAGRLAHLEVVADFLGFRHYTLDRFADTMRWVDLAIVGWPGEPDDATVTALRDVVARPREASGRDVRSQGRAGRSTGSPAARAVRRRHAGTRRGHDLGCGDAFIALLPRRLVADGDLVAAVEQGKVGGALPTAWVRPFPTRVRPRLGARRGRRA